MFKKLLYAFLAINLVVFLTALVIDKTYLYKGFYVSYLSGNFDVTIDDFKKQPTRIIAATNPQPWEIHTQYNQTPLSPQAKKMHEDLKSIAFLVIKDGQILTEKYFREGEKNHLSGVWSITKTYASFLILKAVEDGLIGSIDDPVAKYIPEWDIVQDDTLTLRHLASMSTGLFWNEDAHTPFSLIAKLNFYSNLEDFTINDMHAVGNPGEEQWYNSGGTQVLGTVLDNVLGEKTISDYLSEKFWNPLGYVNDGLFILDSKKHGNEKTYGGIVSTPRDIARLGQVILDNGYWKGEQIFDSTQMDIIKTLPYNNTSYCYGIWTGVYEGQRYYYQLGYLGQFCISLPSHNLVITRFGHKYLPEDLPDVSRDAQLYIEEAIRIAELTD